MQHRISSGGPHGGLWVGVGTTERQAFEAHLATMDEAAALARDILNTLPPADRLAVIRQAAKEADLLVLTRQQAAALLADESGSPVPVADVMDAYLALAEQAGEDTSALRMALDALHGGEVPADAG